MGLPGDSTPSLRDAEAAAAEPPERLAVSIVTEADWSAFEAPEQSVEVAAAALARHFPDTLPDGAEASVVLADDAMVRRLNATYRGKDSPTNVLSFPFQAPPGETGEDASYLGDVILAAETVLAEARERPLAPNAHLQHLVVHGLLHLMGFDHDTDAKAEEMERLETRILASIGIADPYAEDVARD